MGNVKKLSNEKLVSSFEAAVVNDHIFSPHSYASDGIAKKWKETLAETRKEILHRLGAKLNNKAAAP